MGQPEFLFFARSRRSTLAALRGRFDEAERLARTAYDLAVRAGLPDALNVLEGQLAAVAWASDGDLVDEVLELDTPLNTPSVFQAHLLLAADRREEAYALFPAGLSGIDINQVPGPSRAVTLAVVAEVAYRLGDADAAQSVREELLRYPDHFIVAAGAVIFGGAVSRLLGLCAITLDQPDDAVSWLRAAVASNRRVGAAPFVARTQAELATALRRRAKPGDAEEVRQLLAEAARAAAELGMPVLARDMARMDADDAEVSADRPRLGRDGQDWLLTMGGRTTRRAIAREWLSWRCCWPIPARRSVRSSWPVVSPPQQHPTRSWTSRPGGPTGSG